MAKTYTVEQYDVADLKAFVTEAFSKVPVDLTFKVLQVDKEAKRMNPVLEVFVSPHTQPGIRYQIYKKKIDVTPTFTKLDAQAAVEELQARIVWPDLPSEEDRAKALRKAREEMGLNPDGTDPAITALTGAILQAIKAAAPAK